MTVVVLRKEDMTKQVIVVVTFYVQE